MKTKQLLKTIGILILIISVAIFTSCSDDGAPPVAGDADFGSGVKLGTNAIEYDNVVIDYEVGATRPAKLDTALVEKAKTSTFEYAITEGIATGITINPSNGLVTVADTTDVGTYDLKITVIIPPDSSESEKTKSVGSMMVTIAKAAIGGSLSYDNIEATFGTAITGLPKLTSLTSVRARSSVFSYEITGPNVAGITIDATTGGITVATSTVIGTYNITVKLTAAESSNYKGSLSFTLSVENYKRLTGTLLVGDVRGASLGVSKTGDVASGITGIFTYSIAIKSASSGSLTGITVDSSSGAITATGSTTAGSHIVIVTATGDGDYRGTKTAQAVVDVDSAYIGWVGSTAVTVGLSSYTLDKVKGVVGGIYYSTGNSTTIITKMYADTRTGREVFPPTTAPTSNTVYYFWVLGYNGTGTRANLIELSYNHDNKRITLKDSDLSTSTDFYKAGDHLNSNPSDWTTGSKTSSIYTTINFAMTFN